MLESVVGETIKLEKKNKMVEALTDERNFFIVLHYCLLFMAYGVARMICQPWMWELHFYPVLGFAALSLTMALVFALVIAPMLPVFAAVMAMPPHLDEPNLVIL